MNWTNEVPSKGGWYWVMWHGYEFPEVVLVTERKLEIYACGDGCKRDFSEVAQWSTEPLVKPDII